MERPRLLFSVLGCVSLFAFGGCKSDFEFTLPSGHPALSDSSIGSPPNAASPYDQDLQVPEAPSSSGITNPADEPSSPESDDPRLDPHSNRENEHDSQERRVSP